ncbi:hypothetical protein HYQ46_007225 [Verticillium longisporum]|nr:predicted protein [Verticillium alfalfae VaMs.102]EEY22267.1 predicted protein [Verticillium alfalfae VaMs.102]KAG7144036.1 hypothetical protein HYQ46_007225 [Verticillium longisporum]
MASRIIRLHASTTPPAMMRYGPALMVGTSIAVVGSFIASQLTTSSRNLDRAFAKYNSPQSEASRKRSFEGAPDPRTNLLNCLGWK